MLDTTTLVYPGLPVGGKGEKPLRSDEKIFSCVGRLGGERDFRMRRLLT